MPADFASMRHDGIEKFSNDNTEEVLRVTQGAKTRLIFQTTKKTGDARLVIV
jgi:hypothetical protein